MAFSEVDNLHHTLMRFAQRTNDLVCCANSNLERLVNNQFCLSSLHASAGTGEKGYRSSIIDLMTLDGRIAKKPCISIPLRHGLGGAPSDSTERLTSIREQKVPSLRPALPTEILDGIFCLLKQQQLLPVLLSNSFLYLIARKWFYHTVTVKSPVEAIDFLKTILHNRELPHLVRYFDLSAVAATGKKPAALGHPPILSPAVPQHSTSSSSTSTSPQFTHNFYALLHRGLRAMRSLLSLTLELPKSNSPSWILDDCTFMLRQFTTSMQCNHQLAKFLEKQDMIEDLTLRGFQTESLLLLPLLGAAATAFVTQGPTGAIINATPAMHSPILPLSFTLSPSALPRLKSFNAIHAGPGIIHTIMQDRSVEIASIPLFPDRSVSTLDALGSGKTSLRRLSVISFDPGAPEFLFEELARRFKDLEALHLVLLMTDYSTNLFEEYGRILSNFTSLKYITFMAASSNEPPIDEVKIARDWHRACPTLRTVILPKGSVWFYGEISQQDDVASSSGSPSDEG